MADKSSLALRYTRFNLNRLSLSSRARVVSSDGFQRWQGNKKGIASKWDLILANPPYLSAADLKDLQPEVAWEPAEALDGGKDGLDFYRMIIHDAPAFLKPQGVLALEVGIGQARDVEEMLEGSGAFDTVSIDQDDSRIDRVVMSRLRG